MGVDGNRWLVWICVDDAMVMWYVVRIWIIGYGCRVAMHYICVWI